MNAVSALGTRLFDYSQYVTAPSVNKCWLQALTAVIGEKKQRFVIGLMASVSGCCVWFLFPHKDLDVTLSVCHRDESSLAFCVKH